MSGPVPAPCADLSTRLDAITASAAEECVDISAWVDDDGEETFVWISELNRHPSAPKGAGRTWLDRIVALAHSEKLRVMLCCSSWNSRLVSYYEAAGFKPLYEQDEEIYLIACPGWEPPFQ